MSVDHASNDWTDDVSKLHDRLDHEDGLDEEVQVGGLRKSGAQKLVLSARQNLLERRHGEQSNRDDYQEVAGDGIVSERFDSLNDAFPGRDVLADAYVTLAKVIFHTQQEAGASGKDERGGCQAFGSETFHQVCANNRG